MITDIEVTLTKRFIAVLQAANILIPIDYPGIKKDAVNGKLIRVRFGHVPNARYVQLGGGRTRYFGSLLVQIVMPTGTGKGELLGVADAVLLGFHKFREGGLRCMAGSYADGPEESGCITGTVDVPFQADYSSEA